MGIIDTYFASLATFLIPALIFIVLYIGTFDFSRSFSRILITKKEFYLLLFGSILGMLGNIPLIMYGETFLAINIGGGLIPIVLSLYFFKKKFELKLKGELLLFLAILVVCSSLYTLILNINMIPGFSGYAVYKYHIAALLFGSICTSFILAYNLTKGRVKPVVFQALLVFLIVSFCTYAITRYIPDMGIAAEFPYYLLPSLIAAIITLILFRGASEGLLFGYTVTTLGVLVGADVYHLPEIYATSKVFAGAIGGAATMDLVFLGGLITFLILLPFTGRRFWEYSPSFSRYNRIELRIRGLLGEAWALYTAGKYREALEKGTHAIATFYKLVSQENKSIEEFLAEKGKHYALYDLRVLKAEAQRNDINQYDAYRGLVAAHYILGEIENCRLGKYGDIGNRSLAYLIDIGVSLVIIFPFAVVSSLFVLKNATEEINLIVVVAFSSLVGAVCFLYFTLCEYLYGQTLGKKLLHLSVREIYGEKISITAAMMRNLTRFIALTILSFGLSFLIVPKLYEQIAGAGMIVLFIFVSAFSGVFIVRTKHRQRVGDILAETVVV
ncbi:MAG: RDD family protein, partial [Thermoplasmata archaeon]